MGATSAGIHHQVGGQSAYLAVLAVSYPVDPRATAHEPLQGTIGVQRHIREFQSALPYAIFEETPALLVEVDPQITRLADGPTEAVGPASRQVDHKVPAESAAKPAQLFQICEKVGVKR